MKAKGLIILSCLCLSMSSCGLFQPKVTSLIIKKYPPISTLDSVKVFKSGDTVPNSSEVIGIVNVVDSVCRRDVKYDDILFWAKKEAAKAGGNGLAITSYITPSSHKGLYQEMDGTILHITDMNVYPNLPNPTMNIVSSTMNSEMYLLSKMNIPHNTFSINIGIGSFLGEITDLNGNEKTPSFGREFELKYDWTSKIGIGFGLQYSSYKTSKNEYDLNISYFAPNFVYRGGRNKLILGTEVGLGYFHYDETNKKNDVAKVSDNIYSKPTWNYDWPNVDDKSTKPTKSPIYSNSGIGYNIGGSLEYMVSKHIGLGGSFGMLAGIIPNKNRLDGESSVLVYTRFKVTTGLRVYF